MQVADAMPKLKEDESEAEGSEEIKEILKTKTRRKKCKHTTWIRKKT